VSFSNLYCERSVSRVRRRMRVVSSAQLSRGGRRSRCNRCSRGRSMRHIFQLMITPLMFFVNRQCCVFTPSSLSFCQERFAPSVLRLQFAPLLGVEPQDAYAEADHESHAWNADADRNFRASVEALLKSVCARIRR
jgi:hypothetical protein